MVSVETVTQYKCSNGQTFNDRKEAEAMQKQLDCLSEISVLFKKEQGDPKGISFMAGMSLILQANPVALRDAISSFIRKQPKKG